MAQKLLTLKETARMLDVDEAEVKKLVEENRIPHYIIGGKFIRFRPGEVAKINTGIFREGYSLAARRSFGDRFLDFCQFGDFYIAAFLASVLITAIVIYDIIRS